jgi:ATP-dependent helicase HepA
MYQKGQRWSSRNEADLGIGIIIELQHKSFILHFPDTDAERHYAMTQTSLVRRTLTVGDQLFFQDEPYTVKAVREVEGLMEYDIGDDWLEESIIQFPRNDKNELDSLLSLSPAKRMWFDLRRQNPEGRAGARGQRARLAAHASQPGRDGIQAIALAAAQSG